MFILLFLISGCTISPPLNYKNLSTQLNVGMTKEQVTQLLGKPNYQKIDKYQHYFEYESKAGDVPVFLGNLITFPIAVLVRDPIVRAGKSYLTVYFDKNGRVESFGTSNY